MQPSEGIQGIQCGIQAWHPNAGTVFKDFFLSDGKPPRFGITTPRSSGKSVRRNRIKRVMRETYRLNRKRFPDTGAILYLLKSTEDESGLIDEMFELAERIQQKLEQISSTEGKDDS